MYILILGYNDCGEWVYEVEHYDTVNEVESALETFSSPELSDRQPNSVELAVQIGDAPSTKICELINAINDREDY